MFRWCSVSKDVKSVVADEGSPWRGTLWSRVNVRKKNFEAGFEKLDMLWIRLGIRMW